MIDNLSGQKKKCNLKTRILNQSKLRLIEFNVKN